MSRFISVTLLSLGLSAVTALPAAAQFYNGPAPHLKSHSDRAGGLGLDLGFGHHGVGTAAGFGVGSIGAGLGAGIGHNGIGTGANVGLGPLGASTNAGLGPNGLGLGGNAGIGNTGLSARGGISKGGIGAGTSASVLGFGPSVSAGIGRKGPGLGASVGFGPLGTLQLGSHSRTYHNSYPGAQETTMHYNGHGSQSYYQARGYGNAPYYAPAQPVYHTRPVTHGYAPVTACGARWTC